MQLIHVVNSGNVCVCVGGGDYDEQFIRLAHSKKRNFYSTNNKLVAVLEESFCFKVERLETCCTVWHVKCETLLVKDKITLTMYISYRNTLRTLVSKAPRRPRITVSLYTNTHWL